MKHTEGTGCYLRQSDFFFFFRFNIFGFMHSVLLVTEDTLSYSSTFLQAWG